MKTQLNFLLMMCLVLISCAAPITHKRGSDPEEVIQTYRTHLGGTKKCYEDALKEDKSLAGQLTMEWTINDKGEILEPTIIDNDLPNHNFEICIMDHLKNIPFQPTKKWSKATVTYTLTFGRTAKP